MKQILNQIMEDQKTDQVDLCVLSGRRQRYEHFGFTICGTGVWVSLDQENKKHLKSYEDAELFIRPVKQEDIPYCLSLYEKQAIHAKRTCEDFIEIGSSWNQQIYCIEKQKKRIGYLIASSDHEEITEIALESQKVVSVILSWLENQKVYGVRLHLSPYQLNEINEMNEVSESLKISYDSNFCVINYPKVLQAFLQLKHSISPLMEGTFVFQIQDSGTFEIAITKDSVSVIKSEKQPERVFTHIQAMNFFFSPAGLLTLQKEKPLLKNWFPLQLYFPHTDNV